MPRELKFWNGRAYCARKHDDPIWKGHGRDPGHIYIAAYSREDARRVVEEYCGHKPSVGEIRDYFSQCWGRRWMGSSQSEVCGLRLTTTTENHRQRG